MATGVGGILFSKIRFIPSTTLRIPDLHDKMDLPLGERKVNVMCIRKIIGDNVRYIRIFLHLTQQELARRTGTTQKTICRIESYCQNTSTDMLEKLSQALGVPAYALVVETDENKFKSLYHIHPAEEVPFSR